MDTIIPAVQQLNEAGRAKGIPIVYTTTAYAVTTDPNTDMGVLAYLAELVPPAEATAVAAHGGSAVVSS